jgi:hypothetical protein
MQKRLLLSHVAVYAALSGCIISTDNPIPPQQSKPYFGAAATLKTKDFSESLRWNEHKRSYVGINPNSKKEVNYQVATLESLYALPELNPRSSGIASSYFLVTERTTLEDGKVSYNVSIARPAGAVSRIDQWTSDRRIKTMDLEFVEFNPDLMISYVLRYECLRKPDPEECVVRHFTPGSAEFVGVRIDKLTPASVRTKSPDLGFAYTNSTGLQKFMEWAGVHNISCSLPTGAKYFCSTKVTHRLIRD